MLRISMLNLTVVKKNKKSLHRMILYSEGTKGFSVLPPKFMPIKIASLKFLLETRNITVATDQ